MSSMRCHYEVLQVERDADEVTLKKAYRKLALKWHPDKNPDNVEECTKLFAVIQKAYDVLCDPQERAWYDKHRVAIIRGGFGDDYQDDSVNIMAYFSSSAYSSFDDTDTGFYSVYADIFRKIAEEDKRYKEADDSDYDVPEFGNSKSDYEEVVQFFYNYWQSYFTSRSYVWVEQYDTREAENGKIAKLMEKENKKKRDANKKEWNEQVRQLVTFVRKRDKRVQARKREMEVKAAEIARLNEERMEKKRVARAKRVHEYVNKGQEVMQELENDFQQLERDMAAEFGESLSEESAANSEDASEEEEDDLYCVACNKSFRSQKAFLNHENSKKHREKVAILKRELENDDEVIQGKNEENGEPEQEDEEEEGDGSKPKLSKKQKKKRRQQKKMQSALDDEKNEEDASTVTNSEDISDRLSEKLNLDQQGFHDQAKEFHDKPKEEGGESKDITASSAPVTASTETKSEETTESIRRPKTKKNKGNQPSQKNPPVSSHQDVLQCNVCQHEFPTRNKLFNHIKSTGHAIRMTSDTATSKSQTSQDTRKGKRKGKNN